jgi:hypothetical protein
MRNPVKGTANNKDIGSVGSKPRLPACIILSQQKKSIWTNLRLQGFAD